MKKKMTSWLLPLVLVLLLVPCIAVVVSAEDAADTPVVYVGGKPLTVGKYLAVDNPETESDEGVISDTQPSGGYAYLSEDGKTLTLNDYTYEGLGYYYQQKNAYALIFIKSELTIHLIGENSLVAYSNENSLVTYSNEENNVSHLYGIYTRENRLLNINGEGSLNININNENESG
ncbi:MAG: hypothetical protein IJX14_11030, partial [Clostridia bacterium]|nr:hypothetical protein [Clostridia bacterium]